MPDPQIDALLWERQGYVAAGKTDRVAQVDEQIRLLGGVEVANEVPTEYPAKGDAKDVALWVGDDPGRARQALDAEMAASRPRKRLVAKLESLLDEPKSGS